MKLSSCSSIVFVLIWTAELCVLCFAQEDTIFRPESIPPEIGLRMEYFLTVEQYDSCMTDLAITVEKKKVWDQSSFLAFVKRRTDGAIDQNVLDSSILELVYIYWFVICTAVGPDLCLDVSSVTSAQVTEFYFDNGEPLTEEICERMQYYLDQQQDRNRMPSVSPSELPTKSIQLQISESPSTSSPTGMPTKIRIVDEDQEPTFQPSTKSLSPSSSPSLAPTFLSVTEYLTFQIYYNTTDTSDTTTTTNNATTSTTCLQNLIQEYITMELEQIFACPYDDIEHNNMDIDSPTWWCALDVIQISLLEFFPFGTYSSSLLLTYEYLVSIPL